MLFLSITLKSTTFHKKLFIQTTPNLYLPSTNTLYINTIAGSERVPRPEDIQHKLVIGGVRSHWCRCIGGRSCRRSGLQDRLEIPPGVRWLWRLLLPEGYSQLGVHMRMFEFTGGRGLLAAGHRHERVPEVAVLG